jgi:hypothetical protein
MRVRNVAASLTSGELPVRRSLCFLAPRTHYLARNDDADQRQEKGIALGQNVISFQRLFEPPRAACFGSSAMGDEGRGGPNKGNAMGDPGQTQRAAKAKELRRKAALARQAASVQTSGSGNVDRLLVLLAAQLEREALILEEE